MDREELQKVTAEAVRSAEIKAVAAILRSGGQPSLGQSIDYSIVTPPGVSSRSTRPYRLEVEQWHLDAAVKMLRVRH